MAILGLTDRPAAFPTIGVLRKGAPKPESGNKPGADLKHFRFDSDDEGATRLFTEHYGREPRSIRVFVPFKTAAENFEAWKEEWSASSLKHRCDGQTMVRWLTAQGRYSDEPKECTGGCKQVGRLNVIIPELRRMAFVTLQTTSTHDILQIHANLTALENARGDLRGIPLILKRSPREISTPADNGKRARREKWLITIEAAPSWVELQLTAQERAALPQAEPLALPSWDGGDDDDDEAPADPRHSVIERMKAVFADQGKVGEWPAYAAKHVDPPGKDLERLNKLLANLESRASKALVEEIEGPLFQALLSAGVGDEDVVERVALIAEGECTIGQMDYPTLVDVRNGLKSWLGELTKGAAKTA